MKPKASEELPTIPSPPLIVERDDGWFQLGLADDAPGPFMSRRHAEAVAAHEKNRIALTRHLPKWVQQ